MKAYKAKGKRQHSRKMGKATEAFHRERKINKPLIYEKVVDLNNQENANQKLQ